MEALCEAFANLLAFESGTPVEFRGLQRLESAPAPEVLYSTEVPLQTGPPAPFLVGFTTVTNTTLQQLIGPEAPERDSQQPAALASGPLGVLLDLELPLCVRFGRVQMPVERILELRPGAVVELDGAQDEQVDLLVNGSVVARGEVVAVEGNYAIRILEVLSRDGKIASARPSNKIQGAWIMHFLSNDFVEANLPYLTLLVGVVGCLLLYLGLGHQLQKLRRALLRQKHRVEKLEPAGDSRRRRRRGARRWPAGTRPGHRPPESVATARFGALQRRNRPPSGHSRGRSGLSAAGPGTPGNTRANFGSPKNILETRFFCAMNNSRQGRQPCG